MDNGHAEDAPSKPYVMMMPLSIKAGRASETYRILAFVPAIEAHFNSGRVTCSDAALLLAGDRSSNRSKFVGLLHDLDTGAATLEQKRPFSYFWQHDIILQTKTYERGQDEFFRQRHHQILGSRAIRDLALDLDLIAVDPARESRSVNGRRCRHPVMRLNRF